MSEKQGGPDSNGRDFKGQNLKGKKFKDEDFSGADFTGAVLANARFVDCTLDNAVFDKTDMTGMRVEGGSWKSVTFANLDSKKLRLKNVVFENLSGKKSKLENAVFQKSVFKDFRFEKCDLTGAAYYNSAFEKGAFDQTILDNMRCPEASFKEVSLTGCSLKKADMVPVVFENCSLTECELVESDLSGSRLQNSNFLRVDFKSSEMIACDFSNTTLEDCTFEKAIIKYSRGLSEETLAMIKEKGGKIGLDLVRKTANFLFHSKAGRIIVAVFVAAFVGYLAYRTFVPSSWSYEALRSESAKARQEGKIDDVIKYNTIIIDKYGDRPSRATVALLNLAQVNLERQDFKTAGEYFQRAYDLNKEDPYAFPDILIGMGETSLADKKYETADKWYGMVLDKIEDEGYRAIATQGLVRSAQKSGDTGRALDLIEKLLADKGEGVNQMKGQLLTLKVQILKDAKRYDEAVVLLKTMIDSDSKDMARDSYFAWAQIERDRGNRQEAEKIFEKMAEKYPEAIEFVNNSKISQAQQMIANGEMEKGEALLIETMKNAITDQTRRYAKTTLAMHYLYSQRFDEARTLFDELMKEVQPDSHDYWNIRINFAVLLRISGEAEKSVDLLTDAIKEQSGDEDALRWAYQERASSYQSAGEIDKAMGDLWKALELTHNPEFRQDVIVNLLQMASYHGDPQEAIKIGKEYKSQILEEDRLNRFNSLVAEAYNRAGEPEKSVELFRGLLKDCGKDGKCRMRQTIELINALFHTGQTQEAFELYKNLASEDFEPNDVSQNINTLVGLFAGREDARDISLSFYSKVVAAMEITGQRDHNFYSALNNMAQIYLEKNEPDEGIKIYKRVIEECQDDYPRLFAYESLFRYYMEHGEGDKAKELAEDIVKRVKSSTGTVISDILHSELYIADNEQDKAIKLLENTVDTCETDMDCCRALESLVQQYRLNGDKPKMMDAYKKATEKWNDCWVLGSLRDELGL